MPISATVLFERPQHEIAASLRDSYQRCNSAWVITGFATVEGIASIGEAILESPSKLQGFIIGKGSLRGFEALDNLISRGVDKEKLYVHLGFTRNTASAGARNPFYMYHPMLHSKIYLFEMDQDYSEVYVGSHNSTGFALLGLNGEAAVKLTGESNDPEMQKVKSHVLASMGQAKRYDETMKDAYTWWHLEYLEGLKDKVEGYKKDGEWKRTVVIVAEDVGLGYPRRDEIIYFELPAGLKPIQSLGTEVHLYLFKTLPPSPAAALRLIGNADHSVYAQVLGLEQERGGVELEADWYIDGRVSPTLRRIHPPFRPSASNDVLQVRAKAFYGIKYEYEYMFYMPKSAWKPRLDEAKPIVAPQQYRQMLQSLRLIPPEDFPWYLVVGLDPIEPRENEYRQASREAAPEAGGYILVSLFRRRLGG